LVIGSDGIWPEDRLDASKHKRVSLRIARQFLVTRCKLSKRQKTPAVFMRNHDQAYEVIAKLADSGPIELVHVDAHSDLGEAISFYKPKWKWVLTDWIRQPAPRPIPPRRIDAGNWLGYAAANRLLSNILFVPTEKPPDLYRYFFRSEPYGNHMLEFFDLTHVFPKWGFDETWPAIVEGLKPSESVPFRVEKPEEFSMVQRPDFVLVCQSPGFTPKSVDRILDMTRDYLHETDIGVALLPPV
jgi:hypothetical protein